MDRRAQFILVGLLLGLVAAFGQDLDLPIQKDRPAPATEAPTVTVPPPADDPVDLPDPPPVFYGEEIDLESSSLIYVIDISGSMGDWVILPRVENVPGQLGAIRTVPGTGVSRLMRAQDELCRSISGLAASVRFNVVAFDSVYKCWIPGLVPADEPNKEAAKAWVRQLLPGGMTATGPAVVAALSVRENMNIVLLTDGDPNCPLNTDGAWHRKMIRDNNVQGAQIDVFGIDCSQPTRAFCVTIAGDSGGSYFDVR